MEVETIEERKKRLKREYQRNYRQRQKEICGASNDKLHYQCIIYTKNIEKEIASLAITVKKTIIGFKGVQKLSLSILSLVFSF